MHSQLSSEIARQLAPRLRPKYIARTEERYVWEEATETTVTIADLLPDVGVSQQRSNGTGTATAPKLAPIRIATVIPTRVPHVTVEIRDTARRRLVTAIEVLSPTNKHGRGRQEYLKKRVRLLRSSVHLLELDLLRSGQRVPAVNPLPSMPYFAFLSRAETRPFMDVYPISLRAPLPTVPVPLRGGDPDLELDLQLVLTTVYDLLAYDLSIDYTKPPDVPLSAEDAEWAATLIRSPRVSGQ